MIFNNQTDVGEIIEKEIALIAMFWAQTIDDCRYPFLQKVQLTYFNLVEKTSMKNPNKKVASVTYYFDYTNENFPPGTSNSRRNLRKGMVVFFRNKDKSKQIARVTRTEQNKCYLEIKCQSEQIPAVLEFEDEVTYEWLILIVVLVCQHFWSAEWIHSNCDASVDQRNADWQAESHCSAGCSLSWGIYCGLSMYSSMFRRMTSMWNDWRQTSEGSCTSTKSLPAWLAHKHEHHTPSATGNIANIRTFWMVLLALAKLSRFHRPSEHYSKWIQTTECWCARRRIKLQIDWLNSWCVTLITMCLRPKRCFVYTALATASTTETGDLKR